MTSTREPPLQIIQTTTTSSTHPLEQSGATLDFDEASQSSFVVEAHSAASVSANSSSQDSLRQSRDFDESRATVFTMDSTSFQALAASKDHLSLFDSNLTIDTWQETDPGPSSTGTTGTTVDGYGSLAEEAEKSVSPPPMNIQTHQYEIISEDDEICSDEDSPDEPKRHFQPEYQANEISIAQATRNTFHAGAGAAQKLKTDKASLNIPAYSSVPTTPPPNNNQEGTFQSHVQSKAVTSNLRGQPMDSINHQTSLPIVGEPSGALDSSSGLQNSSNHSSLLSIDPRTMQPYANMGMPSANVGSFRVNTELYPEWRQCSQLSMDSELLDKNVSDHSASSSDGNPPRNFTSSRNKGYKSTSLRNNKWNISEEERFMLNDRDTGRFHTSMGREFKSGNHVMKEPAERLNISSSLSPSQTFVPHDIVASQNRSLLRGPRHHALTEHQTPKQRDRHVSLVKPIRSESLREAKRTLEDSFSHLCMQRFQGPAVHGEQERSPKAPIRATSSHGVPTFEGFDTSCNDIVDERPYHRVQSLPTPTYPRPDYTFNDHSQPTMPSPTTKDPDQRRESAHQPFQLDNRRSTMDESPDMKSMTTMETEDSTSNMHLRRDSDRIQSPPAVWDHIMERPRPEPSTVRMTSQQTAFLEKEEAKTPPSVPASARTCPSCERRNSQMNTMDEQCRSPPTIMSPCYIDRKASSDPRAYMEMNQSESIYQMRMQHMDDPRMVGFNQDPRAYVMDSRAMMGVMDGPSAHSPVYNHERSHTNPRATCTIAAREGMGHSEPIINPSSPAVDPRMMDPMMDPRLMGYSGFPPPPLGWGYPQFGRISSYSQEDYNHFVNPELLSDPSQKRAFDPVHTGRLPPATQSHPYMHSSYPYPRYDPYDAYMPYMSSYAPPSMMHHSGASTTTSSSLSMTSMVAPAPPSPSQSPMDPVQPNQASGSNNTVPASVPSRPIKMPDAAKKKSWIISGFLKKSSNVKFKKKSPSVVDADEATASTLLSEEKGTKSPPNAVAAKRKKLFGRK